jgi:hypothetical protein
MQRNAAWLEFLMIPNTEDKAAVMAQRAHMASPAAAATFANPGRLCAGDVPANGPLRSVLGWWPMALAKGLPAHQNVGSPERGDDGRLSGRGRGRLAPGMAAVAAVVQHGYSFCRAPSLMTNDRLGRA